MLFCALVACSSAASPPSMPQIQNSGGPVLTNATLVAVTFGTDPLQATAEDFVQTFANSSVWGFAAEYGVGAATVATPIQSSMALKSSMDETDWQAELPIEMEQSLGGFSPPLAESIYVLFLPPGITATNQGLTGCANFGGYHSALQLSDGTQVAYAIVPRCQSFNSLGLVDSMTGVASHEILEAATDPFDILSKPAWSDVDSADFAFSLAFGGGEICDMCLNAFPPFYTPSDLKYVVQRSWSNAAARQNQDPCVPASDAGAFIQAFPQLGTQSFNVNGTSTSVRSLSAKVGQSVSVPLSLFSAPSNAPAWGLSVINIASADSTASVDWTISPDAGLDGETAELQLTVQSAGTQTGISGNSELIAVVSEAGARLELWPILITNPD